MTLVPLPESGTGWTPNGALPGKGILETEIAANADGATVQVTGTDQVGPAPFMAKLEEGKTYKVRITARGFATCELEVTGGASPVIAKLVAKPRLVTVFSDPSGAAISIDGTPTGKSTPAELELVYAAIVKKSVRVVLRKAGFHVVDRTIDFAKFVDGETKMTARIEEKLTPAPVAARP